LWSCSPAGGESDSWRRLVEFVAFGSASGDDPGGPFGDVAAWRWRPGNVVDGGGLGCAAAE
ncbi:MAG: hypothetical protein ACERLM_14015, partial [Acidimicrobiales bacterium]